jgi:hypothetical protein
MNRILIVVDDYYNQKLLNDESQRGFLKNKPAVLKFQDCRFADAPGSTFMFGKGRGFRDSRAA